MRTNYTSNGHICFKRKGLHVFSRRKLRLAVSRVPSPSSSPICRTSRRKRNILNTELHTSSVETSEARRRRRQAWLANSERRALPTSASTARKDSRHRTSIRWRRKAFASPVFGLDARLLAVTRRPSDGLLPRARRHPQSALPQDRMGLAPKDVALGDALTARTGNRHPTGRTLTLCTEYRPSGTG